ncbi:RNA polymerase sigma factor [Ferruginibacter sp.]|nr:sigma-70 family RNA polymerase sigma factor [Ferruginibacter sp.]
MAEQQTYTEQNLTQALKKYDNDAFEYLYNNYKGALFTVVMQIIPDKIIAEDVLQDAFITAWKNIDKYDSSKGRLFTWLFNVTRNCAINTTRSKNYKSEQKNDSIDNYVSYVDEKENTIFNINQIGLRNQIHQLRDDYKNVVELSYFDGYTHEEIAKILVLPVGTVKTRLRNALIELRKQFV